MIGEKGWRYHFKYEAEIKLTLDSFEPVIR